MSIIVGMQYFFMPGNIKGELAALIFGQLRGNSDSILKPNTTQPTPARELDAIFFGVAG